MEREPMEFDLGAAPPPADTETRWAQAVKAAAPPEHQVPPEPEAVPESPAHEAAPEHEAAAAHEEPAAHEPMGDRMTPIFDAILGLLSELEREARATITRAETQVGQVREGANRQAAAVVDQARADADNIRTAARAEADRVIAQSDLLTRDYLSRLSGLIAGLRGPDTGGWAGDQHERGA